MYKVLMIGPYPPCVGGTSEFLRRLVLGLESVGVACQVVNTRAGDPTKGLMERMQRLFLFSRVAVDVVRAPQPIVHCHAVTSANLMGNGIVLLLARTCRKDVILTLHAGDLLDVLTNSASAKHAIVRWILRLPHAITAVTPDLTDAVRSLGDRKVQFIPNSFHDFINFSGINTQIPDEISEFNTSHKPLVVLVGAMQPVYGIDVMIRALGLARAEYPEIGAIVIAYKSEDLAYRRHVEDLVSTLSLTDAVLFPKSLSDVPAVVALADTFVRPSSRDGDSLAVREALALGVPVVASEVGFRPAGTVLFRPGDSADLADKMLRTLSHPLESVAPDTARDPDPVQAYSDVYRSVSRNRSHSSTLQQNGLKGDLTR
jgi:glycogen(starch) synthase